MEAAGKKLIVPVGISTMIPPNCGDDMARWRLSKISSWEMQKLHYPYPKCAVVASTDQRRCLLQAACLASVLKAPLLTVDGGHNTSDLVLTRIEELGVTQVFCGG